MKTEQEKWNARQLKVMGAVHANPGKNAIMLGLHGVTKQDAVFLKELEHAGLIEYRSGGWHATSKGDIWYLENAR